MEDFMAAVANIGFPIAVAGYLLIRVEKKIDDLTKGVNELSKAVEDLKEVM
ncbi:YvrJ family protein [Lutibacter sp. B2]|nr:YvrJ family protein [Lutibacter sp. B2]